MAPGIPSPACPEPDSLGPGRGSHWAMQRGRDPRQRLVPRTPAAQWRTAAYRGAAGPTLAHSLGGAFLMLSVLAIPPHAEL